MSDTMKCLDVKRFPGTNKMTIGVHELAERLGVHPNTIYLWKSAGEIEYTRLGRKIVFTMQQVQDFLDAHRERETIDRSILATV